MQLTLRVKDDMYEKMKARMTEKGFSSMNAYIVDLIIGDLEPLKTKRPEPMPKVSLDTILSDHYLMHWFIGKYEETMEDFRKAKIELIMVKKLPPDREHLLEIARTIIQNRWSKLEKSEQDFWLELSQKWLSKAYKDFILRELLQRLWISDTISEFAEYLGVSYQEAYYKIKPQLTKMATHKGFQLYRPEELFVYPIE